MTRRFWWSLMTALLLVTVSGSASAQGMGSIFGKVRDRRVCTPEPLQNAASGGVRERGERGIEAGPAILNHMVQYSTHGLAGMQGDAEIEGARERGLER